MKSVILFGTGEIGKQLLEFIGVDQIAFLVDNNKDKVGKHLEGIEIISFERLVKIHKHYHVIIATGVDYMMEIANQLSEESIPFSTYHDFPFYWIEGKKHFLTADEIIANNDLYSLDDFCVWGDNWFANILVRKLEGNKKKVHIVDCKKDYTESDVSDVLNKYSVHVLCIANSNVVIGNEKVESYRSQVLAEKSKVIIDCYDQDCFEEAFYNPQLEQYKDKYKGKRCFIIGNGPSLRIEDLELLHKNKEFTFGLNRIYKIFDKTNWRPTFYCFVDYLMICNSFKEIVDVDCNHKFILDYFNIGGENCPPKRTDFNYLHVNCMEYKYKFPKFGTDAARTLYMGYTVTYIAIQLACYMGFSEIYLLGVDHSLNVRNYREAHFVDGYFGPNEITYALQMDASTLAYRKSFHYIKNIGVKIYNATRGGVLEEFERVSFDEIMRN